MPRCVQQRTHAARSIANTARGSAPPSAAAPRSPSAAAAPPSAAAPPAPSPPGTGALPDASARAHLSSAQKRLASGGVAGRAGLRYTCVAWLR